MATKEVWQRDPSGGPDKRLGRFVLSTDGSIDALYESERFRAFCEKDGLVTSDASGKAVVVTPDNGTLFWRALDGAFSRSSIRYLKRAG